VLKKETALVNVGWFFFATGHKTHGKKTSNSKNFLKESRKLLQNSLIRKFSKSFAIFHLFAAKFSLSF